MAIEPSIALIGDENPTYPSHRELNAVRSQLGVRTEWIPTDGLTIRDLEGFAGVWLVPGSPYADDAAVYAAIRWVRENNIAFLGTCGGLQYAVIEFLRNALGKTASHAESDGFEENNAVTPLACSLFGQEREVHPVPGTRFAGFVGDAPFTGMHYCNYAPTEAAIAAVIAGGMSVQATALDAPVEVLELPRNHFYYLSLFQPQIGALARKPLHPLLVEFVRAVRG